MNKKRRLPDRWPIILTLLAFTMVVPLTGCISGSGLQKASARSLPPETTLQMVQTTVQITMFQQELTPLAESKEVERGSEVQTVRAVTDTARGIGTLTTIGGRVYLITHDHWPFLTGLNDPDWVQFHDVDGQLLLELPGSQVRPLVVFHDMGTLILRAPEPLVEQVPVAADVGPLNGLALGTEVLVARHRPGEAARVEFLAAEIESIVEEQGVPRLHLRSRNGTSIEPGDSGGGIWVDGRLVGNMWMTVRRGLPAEAANGQAHLRPTAESIAAGLTGELVALVQALQVMQEPVPASEGAPS